MRIDVITIFPEMIANAVEFSVIKRAQENGLLEIVVHDLRDFAHNQHRSVDDYCYGGGAGMLMKPEPLFEAVRSIDPVDDDVRIILLSPQGKLLTQDMARRISLSEHLILICGRYKGVDERVRQNLITDEISIGDYVLSGGEIPALAVIDAVSRLIPGALGNYESAQDDSFSEGLLDCPHYTRPAEYQGMQVPEVLLSGDHKKIREWQRQQAVKRTFQRRPDLLEDAPMSEEDLEFLDTLKEGDT
ncbi:tRNA (guanosine(37)-N1)-methyltransferase TrmD [Candidatus Poribacteria bacterium]